jgi:hypothetical protein
VTIGRDRESLGDEQAMESIAGSATAR